MQAEYATKKNKLNQVVLWDAIIQNKARRAQRAFIVGLCFCILNVFGVLAQRAWLVGQGREAYCCTAGEHNKEQWGIIAEHLYRGDTITQRTSQLRQAYISTADQAVVCNQHPPWRLCGAIILKLSVYLTYGLGPPLDHIQFISAGSHQQV